MLVHNLYGQAAPASRSAIRFAMLGLALIWGYDLNLYTISYLGSGSGSALVDWRGAVVALTAPLFALGAKQEDGWRIRLSRAATFQSLSLLAICGYFAVMTVLATALRGTGWDWAGSLLVALLALFTVAAMVLCRAPARAAGPRSSSPSICSSTATTIAPNGCASPKRSAAPGTDAPPLGERVIKAFADIVDAPGGLLLVTDGGGATRDRGVVELARPQPARRSNSRAPAISGASVESARPDPRARRLPPALGPPQGSGDRRAGMDCRR